MDIELEQFKDKDNYYNFVHNFRDARDHLRISSLYVDYSSELFLKIEKIRELMYELNID